MSGLNRETLLRNKGLVQFVKFCLIGATSAVIDLGLFTLLQRYWNPILARTLSVAIAVVNGFIWNSLWTFRGMGSGRRHEQFVKFAAINVVGLGLNILIMETVFFLLAHRLPHANDPDKLHLYLGLFIAIVIVSVWNFLANKKWTFSSPPVADSSR